MWPFVKLLTVLLSAPAPLLESVSYNVEVSLTILAAIHLEFLYIYRVNNMFVPENSSLCRL